MFLEVEACIDVKLALVDEYDEPVPWSNEFRDLGSPSSRSWMEKVSETLPDLHFISNTNLAFVEIAQVKYSEFNDQVNLKIIPRKFYLTFFRLSWNQG